VPWPATGRVEPVREEDAIGRRRREAGGADEVWEGERERQGREGGRWE